MLVSSSVENFVLLTEAAVLHGTPEQPCVAAWGAHAIPIRGGDMRAIIRGDLARGWLFRLTPDKSNSLDVRPMQCSFAPGTPIPNVVWTQPGTIRSSP